MYPEGVRVPKGGVTFCAVKIGGVLCGVKTAPTCAKRWRLHLETHRSGGSCRSRIFLPISATFRVLVGPYITSNAIPTLFTPSMTRTVLGHVDFNQSRETSSFGKSSCAHFLAPLRPCTTIQLAFAAPASSLGIQPWPNRY